MAFLNYLSHHQDSILKSISCDILHKIDDFRRIEVFSGDLNVLVFDQGPALLIKVVSNSSSRKQSVKWEFDRYSFVIKSDDSNYLFTIRDDLSSGGNILKYELIIKSRGQESLVIEFDKILAKYGSFKKTTKTISQGKRMDDGSPADSIVNVSELLTRKILQCGEAACEKLKLGYELAKQRMGSGNQKAQISRETLQNIKRLKEAAQKSNEKAEEIYNGVRGKFSHFERTVSVDCICSSVDSDAGAVLRASLDGFGKVRDAFGKAGKNVLSTSSECATDFVAFRYGEEAAEATRDGIDVALFALGAVLTAFTIYKTVNSLSKLNELRRDKR